MQTESIWSSSTFPTPRSSLREHTSSQAVVIGAGIAGVLTAFFLQQKGMETVVLEADRIGGGQTKNTTAKITLQHGLIYDRLLHSLGPERAGQYVSANLSAIRTYTALIHKYNIPCGLRELPSCLYSVKETGLLEKEAAAAQKLGLSVSLKSVSSLPFPVKGTLCLEKQAQLHPLRFLAALAEQLTVYEQTPALRVKENTVYTPNGSVTAEHIIFATHYPFVNAPGYFFLRMHQERSYVAAVCGAPDPGGMYYGIDKDGGLGSLSFRGVLPEDGISEPLLLLGGMRHRTGEKRDALPFCSLRHIAGELYPQARMIAGWAAQDCITPDAVPYIGQYSSRRANWHVATGFNKWGMTGSMVAAMLIADAITGVDNPDRHVFSPQRLSLKGPLVEGCFAVRGYAKRLLVHRHPRCPHLGCALTYNPEELSWDCPCHGSRFDRNGKLIDNPAQTDMPNPPRKETHSS